MAIDTRSLFGKIVDTIEEKEDEYKEKLDCLEEKQIQEEQITILDENNVNDIYSLLDYYANLKCNIERLSFQRFALSVIGTQEETEIFFQELKNLTLLRRTQLLKYATDQENYSRRIIGNFLLKLGNVKEELKIEDKISKQMKDIQKKLDLLIKYKLYFAPIGIVKEVENPKEFASFLKQLSLSKKDRRELLVMAFGFNKALHDETLNNYTLNLQSNETLIKKKVLISKEEKEAILPLIEKEGIKKYIPSPKKEKSKQEEIEILTIDKEEVEEPVIFQTLDYDKDVADDLFKKANEDLKKNANKDPYDLFLNYYETLLGNDQRIEELKIVEKAKEYLEKNISLIESLSEIDIQDLEDTLKVYKEDENLREEVYKTTEKLDRLLTYEIYKIIHSSSYDEEEEDNLNPLAEKLKPIVLYLERQNKNQID